MGDNLHLDQAKPTFLGQYQWAPGTQEGPHRRPVTTANKFSVLNTEDDEDTEIDETGGHEEASSVRITQVRGQRPDSST